ncbi:Excisionase/Xis, DNA-binding (modular protein) [Nostocoides japonicum T1-X7]|uniref:Excisionase/Xis, DNA-binding (Modular protein) n=1 Tax=Nostocoides japonicum T1-X7 TaxID=1194083 RepID=A0A077LVM9_9MICO|nr:helix-turn-helix domain-containing protein [Tetrasphaera japonica]CCH77736.1 Excisionase/Xis, DNA-binding (modular protein) [Tetrasphaera japonica T1-X7]
MTAGGTSPVGNPSHRLAERDLLVLEVTPEAAGHIAVALLLHAKEARKAALDLPVGLDDLTTAFVNRARRGQDGSPLQDLWKVRQAAVVTPRLLTYADTAKALGVGESTVKRLVRRGDITAVHVLGAARIPVAEVDAYITRLLEEDSHTDKDNEAC